MRVRVRHFNVVEAELKAATDEAQRVRALSNRIDWYGILMDRASCIRECARGRLTPTPPNPPHQIAIPIQEAAGSGGQLRLAAVSGAQQNNTENRWLGRMLSNALAEVRARADTYDAAGALLRETVAGVAEEGGLVWGWVD